MPVDPLPWRSLEELRSGPSGEGEFPAGADLPDGIGRRDLLRLMGATAAISGLTSCMGEPRSELRAGSRLPSAQPGATTEYATAMFLHGYAEGLVARTMDGRPLKLDGHPEHPATLGGSSIHQQALLFELYDPQRTRAVLRRGLPSSWSRFFEWASRPRSDGGAGLRFLLGPSSSPTTEALIERIRTTNPQAKVYFHDPSRGAPSQRQTRYDLRKARVICSIGEDFLGPIPFGIRYARDFADGRRLLGDRKEMNRLYVIESDLSVTGMKADHRLARKPNAMRDAAFHLLRLILAAKGRPAPSSEPNPDQQWLQAVATDLLRHPGETLVMAGDAQPPDVHTVVQAVNELIGANGVTVVQTSPVLLGAGTASWQLSELIAEMKADAVDELVIIEGNPVVTAAEFDFQALLRRVPHVTYAGLYANATARQAEWVLPLSQQLERWEDGRAVDGTLTFAQPLVRPLHDTRGPLEILATYAGTREPDGHDVVREHWLGRAPLDAPDAWPRALRDGFVRGTALPTQAAPSVDIAGLIAQWKSWSGAPYELNLRPDFKVFDGRFANNLWLLELADPVTKLTWDNAALVSPVTAAALQVKDGQHLQIKRGVYSIELPTIVLPGHADDTVTVPLGFGVDAKAWSGNWLAPDVGVDAFPLRHQGDLSIKALPTRSDLALTQTHWSMEGRTIGPTRTLAHLDEAVPQAKQDSILPVVQWTAPEQWGMAIDLTTCTGCSACVTACQAENNTPIVGKGGVLRSREMHWIRIDRYFSGSPDAPTVVTQPMLCQHCEKAPCEYVCPVYATTHSPDGLNEQTYNRCVGTRFCQNNCPYKVRRFNWFDYNIRKPPEMRLMMNPEVTVRARGVIEKCTYCVQRIRGAQIEARKEQRPLRDGEVTTACQDACPTRAIVFGNIADPNAAVSRWMREPRVYQVLTDLGTQPRTRYLPRITNPNPELA